MRLLLDTHALIWWAGDTEQLSQEVVSSIDAADQVWVSAVTAYEMSLKYTLGKLPGVSDLLPELQAYLDGQRFSALPLGIRHAEVAGRLPLAHRDPFDRMLIAQALTEDLTLVSNETVFDQFGVRRLW